jgi:protein ImuB
LGRSIARRVISIWFPRLPLDRARRDREPGSDDLFALTREEKSAVRISVLSDLAAAAGLEVGMTLADARAVVPDLLTMARQPLREERLLHALQRHCERYTPSSAVEGEDGLILDATGCAHLFGGEEAMLGSIQEDLSRLGVELRCAIADTPGAARAYARWKTSLETPHLVVPLGGGREALADLPVAATGAEAETIELLHRLGLQKIGQLYPIKPAVLARRTGLAFVERLDRLLGRTPEPVVPERPLPSFSARISFPDPIGLLDDTILAARKLTARVCERLNEAAFGARVVELELHRADKSVETIRVGLAWPSRDEGLILGQLAPRLERVDARTGIDLMRLVAVVTEPHTGKQHGMAEARPEGATLENLVASLGNRVGFERVRSPIFTNSHLPERSWSFGPPSSRLEGDGRIVRRGPPRPYRSFRPQPIEPKEPGRPPRSFAWQHRSFEVETAAGPERILPEWWTDDKGSASGPRDYYRVQTKEGERLWLLHLPAAKGEPNWSVAGLFP